MARLLFPALAATLVAAGGSYSTDYGRERALRVEITTTIASETTDFSIERDGEPMDGGGFGGSGSEAQRSIVYTDTIVAHEDGAPTEVQRAFETIDGSSTMFFGENSRESSNETPLEGVTLALALDDDGEVTAEVLDGDEPDDDAVLAGHSLTLGVDAFLPDGEVALDESWELDADQVLNALSLDLEKAYFAPPVSEEEEGERGRGRRGRRGGGHAGGFSFADAEWEGTATLVGTDEEYDETTCAVIRLELKAEGDMPEREFGGGGRERGRALASTTASTLVDNTYSITLKGNLYFDPESALPLFLEVEGETVMNTLMERSGGESEIRVTTTVEGTFRHTVAVTPASNDE